LKLKCSEPLSNFAFLFNLRHYNPFDDIEGQSNAVAANTLRLGSALMELSGDSIPAEITSTGKMLALVFTSDGSVNRPGFAAVWEATTADPVRDVAEASNAPCVGLVGKFPTENSRALHVIGCQLTQ
jgi:hypothetical protein